MLDIKNNKGVILVLTLIIMSILLATAISFAVFIISDVKQAKSIDDSIGAYYGADAGIERSLYQFRKLDIKSTANLTQHLNLLSSAATWSVANSTDTEDVIVRQRIYNGQSVKLFFLNRGDGTNPVKGIGIVWKKGKDSSNSNMQVTFTQLTAQTGSDGQSIVYYTDQSHLERTDVGGFCYAFKDAMVAGPGQLSVSPDYAVEIKALGTNGDYIENFKLQAYNSDDCSNIPIKGAISNISIVSEGTKNQSLQKITAQIPPRDPSSGILSFVLFSEEDITKQ